jgi:transposase InsO family protein
MHYRLIHDKRSDTCAAVLAEAFELWAPPCVLGSDNGGEFTGAAFTSVLQQFGVFHWRTTPDTPEQNGKMERFWGTLESARRGGFSEELIADIVRFYNTT